MKTLFGYSVLLLTSAQAGASSADAMATMPIALRGATPSVQVCMRAAAAPGLEHGRQLYYPYTQDSILPIAIPAFARDNRRLGRGNKVGHNSNKRLAICPV